MPAIEWKIELRTNFADRDKNEAVRQIVLQSAKHLNALALLLHDGVKPDIAAYGDDWFAGRQDINLLEDVIQQGLDQSPSTTVGDIDQDLMKAMQEMQEEKSWSK